MTIVAPSPQHISAGPLSAPSSANQRGDSSTADQFGALVNAQSRANEDANASAPSTPGAAGAGAPAQDETTPHVLASPSAAAIAMVSSLDRSANMLSHSALAGRPSSLSVDKNEKLDAQTPAPTADATLSGIVPPAGVLLPVSLLLPSVSVKPNDTDSVATTKTSAASGAKATTRAAAASAVPGIPLPASNDLLAAAQRSLVRLKTHGGEGDGPGSKTAPEFTSALVPAGAGAAITRNMLSQGADGATTMPPSDVAVVNRHLDLARGDAWLNDLARDIAATATNGGRLKFGLVPETLGRMDVEIRQGAAGVSVHMTTSTESARDMLTAAQPRIVDEIRAQGVRVAGTQVSTDASGFGGDRAGGAPRQPTGLPIDIAPSFPAAASPRSAEAVANGRFA